MFAQKISNDDDTADIDTESTVDEDTSSTGFALAGDIRPLVNYRDRDGRDGVTDSDTEAQARLRLGEYKGASGEYVCWPVGSD